MQWKQSIPSDLFCHKASTKEACYSRYFTAQPTNSIKAQHSSLISLWILSRFTKLPQIGKFIYFFLSSVSGAVCYHPASRLPKTRGVQEPSWSALAVVPDGLPKPTAPPLSLSLSALHGGLDCAAAAVSDSFILNHLYFLLISKRRQQYYKT